MSRRSSIASSGQGSRCARVLHLDAFSGIAGNMFLGALLDLGLSRRALDSDLRGLGVPFRLNVARVRRGPLDAKHVEVVVPGAAKSPERGKRPARSARHGDLHHDHHHDHDLPHGAERRDPAPGRSWQEIRKLLAGAKLEASVRERALAIFEALAAAEARVHGMPIDRVHFHEVGAIDALVDITGAAIGLHRLGIARVTCSPLPLGHGTVGTAHGTLPLPAPATLELLRGAPIVPAGIAWETVTPTGAAIVHGVVDAFCTLPAMRVEAIGHGAGNDRAGGLPNVLRALLGHGESFGADRVAVLETHIDDLNPEHFEYLMERLFEAGALDVALMHLQMKKNRPGFAVRVVARPSQRSALAAVLFAESTTLGVRVAEMERIVLERESTTVRTAFGPIRVKLARGADGSMVPSAEYDDCKRAARRAGVPLREVVRVAEEQARTVGATRAAGSRRRIPVNHRSR